MISTFYLNRSTLGLTIVALGLLTEPRQEGLAVQFSVLRAIV